MTLCMGVSGYFTYLIKNGDRSGNWVNKNQIIIKSKGKLNKMIIFVLSVMFLGACFMPVTLCLHVYGRYADYSMDYDGRIVPNRNPRNRPFH